jgi:hypothetical protein
MRKLLLLPLLFAAACDGGSGPSGSAELTAAEAAQLSRAMFDMAADFASAGLPSGGLPGAGLKSALTEENTFTLPINETVDCMPSGSTDLDGTVTFAFDDVDGAMSIEADVSVRPEACAHVLENGDVIKITGDPDLDVQVAMAGGVGQDLTSLSVTEKGAFTWTRGGASGRCAVDLASALNAATQMVTVTGTFCGFPVSETFPVEA